MLEKEHSIQKVFAEVNTRSKKIADEYKNSLESFLQDEVFPEIEKYFNSQELENEEFIQQVENLSIEVTMSNNNKTISFSSVKQEIKEQIVKKIKAVFSNPELHEVAVTTVPIIQSKTDSFFHFLQHGTIAWWNTTKEESFTNKELFEITESSNFEERFLRALSNPIQKKRLIQQFKDEELQILFLGIIDKTTGYVEFLSSIKEINLLAYETKNKIRELFIDAILSKDFSRIIVEIQEVIKISKSESISNSDQKKLTSFLKLLASKSAVFVNQFDSERLKGSEVKSNKRSVGVAVEKFNDRKEERVSIDNEDGVDNKAYAKNEKINEEPISVEKGIDRFSLTNEIKGGESQNKKNSLKEEASDKEKKLVEKEELKINEQKENKSIDDNVERNSIEEKTLKEQKRADYQRRHQEALKNTFSKEKEVVSESKSHIVKNAGLILLHPFLKQFFYSCGFLNQENQIIKPDEAVHLLHYAATKKEQQYESNLVFEKFLCNIPIYQSIERKIILSDEVKEKSEELLKAVLQNWEVLKNSSPDLLRNEYLQREGKLDLTKDNPTLTVERKTQDILLDTKLPWNLSLCKLPWKKELIFTNW
ncbi:contractile injection system tape measure protein [Tenacibaculum sp.]|uniref:contractile injection system tape measure protein n=1 Tax=Tenacibaculum sp. TaxID=1906242 RepID=UPI003D151224